MRNSPEIRDQFGLLNTWEHVQNPDNISRENSFLAGFLPYSGWVDLGWVRVPTVRGTGLGVRYAREIS